MKKKPVKVHNRHKSKNPVSRQDPETFTVSEPSTQKNEPQPRSNTYVGKDIQD